MPSKEYFIGVSLGKPNQYSAAVVMQIVEKDKMVTYNVVKMERFALGAAYHTIADRLKRVYENLEYEGIAEDERVTHYDRHGADKSYRPCNYRNFVFERTSVGVAVMKLFTERGLYGKEVFINRSTKANSEEKTVPEQDIRDALLLVLQSNRLSFAAGLPDIETLGRQAQEFCNENAKVKAGTDEIVMRDGVADDLMWAWAVAVWESETKPRYGSAGFCIGIPVARYKDFSAWPRRGGVVW